MEYRAQLCAQNGSWHPVAYVLQIDVGLGLSRWQVEKQYKKRLVLRCIHHFKSDLINMEYMRISGTEPSSVILGFVTILAQIQFIYSESIQASLNLT